MANADICYGGCRYLKCPVQISAFFKGSNRVNQLRNHYKDKININLFCNTSKSD